MLIGGLFPHRTRFFLHSIWLMFRKWRMLSSLLLFLWRAWDRLIPLVSPHTTTFVLFLSYENPTNCSFHRILITQIHNEGNKVQALSWADWYSVAWTVQNLWRIWLKHKIEGAVNSPGLGFPKCIPRAINSPPTIKKLRATVVMSLR